MGGSNEVAEIVEEIEQNGEITPYVDQALTDLPLHDRDAAAAALARRYASAIDEHGTPEVLKALGPPLLSALEALGATPRSRAMASKEVAGGTLARFREEAAARRD